MQQEHEKTNQKSRLKEVIRERNKVRGNIFEVDGKYGPMYEVKFSRWYEKSDGDKGFTSTFRASDLPFSEKAIARAYRQISYLEAENRSEDDNTNLHSGHHPDVQADEVASF